MDLGASPGKEAILSEGKLNSRAFGAGTEGSVVDWEAIEVRIPLLILPR